MAGCAWREGWCVSFQANVELSLDCAACLQIASSSSPKDRFLVARSCGAIVTVRMHVTCAGAEMRQRRKG